MKPAALIAVGIAMSLSIAARATTDAAPEPSVTPVSVPHPAREILRGVVAAVDERNDRITVRLPSDASTDLKVRDGLLFNAVRYGDEVEVTVENIDGAATIVDLMKN
jgi:hypothetical protein